MILLLCQLLFYSFEVKKSLIFNYGGNKAVKLNKNVNIVSVSASSSILCKKKCQLAIILAENVFLSLIKISSEDKVLLFVICEKRIRGQGSWITTHQCVPLFTWRWFVLKNLNLTAGKIIN